ncbi:MAG TPA: FAD-dependent thymidylate synthase [Solirubrobacterales bacterium]|nr:FAD-dependent thymidylate synthase [Solirubrobacterales bacterium]
MHYPRESFTEAERAKLANHFTNLESPVFALINLPETVKGALFARYSRYQGTLRRLFLEEFADGLPDIGELPKLSEGRRAAELYERVFIGFGDDSVAQLGGAHVACEWTSNVMTKILQRPRLASYLEQSTRYIPYDRPMQGGDYRYYRHPALGMAYEGAMDSLFETYSSLLPRVTARLDKTLGNRSDPPAARARMLKAKALDLLRGLLPASSLSHMGIFATGQAYESLILHLLAHPLPEARKYGAMMLNELETVIPSFVARIERPDRGGEWVSFLRARQQRAADKAASYGLGGAETESESAVRLLDHEGSETDILVSLLFEASTCSEVEIRETVDEMPGDEQSALLTHLVGPRTNRRHRPGRGFERVRYRFEIVSDYAAFRDLQRHRLLTVQWQGLTPNLGAHMPEELEEAGVADEYNRAIERSRAEYHRLEGENLGWAAPYALCLAFRMRYVLDLTAREALHVIELRSSPQGHGSYRRVAQEMHRQIQDVHPRVADSMEFVDHTPPDSLHRAVRRLEKKDQLRITDLIQQG